MKYTVSSINDEKADPILKVMRRPWDGDHSDGPYFEALEAPIMNLTFAELLGLILRLFEEDITVTLHGLDDIRWVLATSEIPADPDVDRNRMRLAVYVGYLVPYNKDHIPRAAWSDVAVAFKAFYVEQIQNGIVPDVCSQEWEDFYQRYIPAIDEELRQAGIKFQRRGLL